MFKVYKQVISPILIVVFGHACRFTPSCSEYMDEAVHKYGIIKGGVMGVKRIIKCNPLSEVAYDPVK